MQPALTSDKGVVIVIGVKVHDDRACVVLPCATDSPSVNADILCSEAVLSAKEALVPLITPCLSSYAEITFIEAHPMDAGTAQPYREDFVVGTYPGEEVEEALPASVGGLMCFYQEPADGTPGAALRHSRMNLPGIAESMVTLSRLTTGALTDLNTLANKQVDGFKRTAGTITYYRVLAAPAADGGNAVNLIRLTQTPVARGYVGTQRRRLLPHV